MRRWQVRLLLLITIAVAVALVRRRSKARTEPARPVWPPFEEGQAVAARTSTANAVSVEVKPPSARWTDPVEKACPAGFPVKVKLASGIYHLPGMLAYERTSPDRCYVSAEEAEADGFRAAIRMIP
jgi:hypothetical protein